MNLKKAGNDVSIPRLTLMVRTFVELQPSNL